MIRGKRKRKSMMLLVLLFIVTLSFGEELKPVALRSVYKMNPQPWSLGIGLVIGSNGSVEDRRHYFIPDFYDQAFTIVAPEACPDDDKRNCGFERGQIYWGSLKDEGKPEVNESSVNYRINSFQRRLWQNDTGTGNGTVSGLVSIHDHGGSTWHVQDQLTRKILGSNPWRPTIGLATAIESQSTSHNNSFIENFNKQVGLPSLSWSYTFNTPNLDQNGERRYSPYFFPDIVLGGYDQERCNFSTTNTTYKFQKSFNSDYFRIPAVQMGLFNGDSLELSRYPLSNILLDSAAPFIWLPKAVSDAIAQSLDVSWDPVTLTYPMTNGSRKDWRDHGLQIYFDVSQNSTSNISMKISAAELLPVTFHAFEDAKESSTSYLPIRPLPPNQEQIVFGIPFFQAACMLTNYETEQFHLTARSQHRETQTNPGTFVAIKSLKEPEPASSDSAAKSRGDSFDKKRTAIEVVVGVVAVIVIALLFWWGRRRRSKPESATVPVVFETDGAGVHEIGESKKNQIHEVEGSAVISPDTSTTVGSTPMGSTPVGSTTVGSTRVGSENSPRYVVSPMPV